MRLAIMGLDGLQQPVITGLELRESRLAAGGEVIGSQIDDGDVRLPALKLPGGFLRQVEGLEIPLRHVPATAGFIIIPVDALARVGGADDIGAEVSAQDVGISLRRVFILGTERVLPDAVLRTVSAGVGVADELDDTFAETVGLKE